MNGLRCGIVLFSFIACCVSSATDVRADDAVVTFQKAFNDVAEKVYPSVVSLTTVQLQQADTGEYYSPLGETSFDNFFGGLFGFSADGRRQFESSHYQSQTGVGSGIIVSDDGYILTNYHLVGTAETNKVTVKLANGKEYVGLMIGADAKYDLAVIKINEKDLTAAPLADSSTAKVGDWAIAIGNPYGFLFKDAQPTMTVGVVSALNRSLPAVFGQSKPYTNLIQTDASINLGNSGGPLVNIQGEVMGVNVAIVSTTGGNQGIGFAIPSNQCKNVLAQFVKGQQIVYSWLGIKAQNLTEDLAEYFAAESDYGIVAMQSIKGSPAYKAGIKDGDVLLAYNGKKLTNMDALLRSIELSQVGDFVIIDFVRNGERRKVSVKIEPRPQSTESFELMQSLFWRGLRVDAMTEVLINRYNLPAVNGVIVTDLLPGSNADRSGIIEGDVVIRVNERDIKSLDDYYSVVNALSEDALVKTLRGYYVVKKNYLASQKRLGDNW